MLPVFEVKKEGALERVSCLMSSRLGWFALGLGGALMMLVMSAYIFLRAGGVSMDTTTRPLPLEETVARMALRASLGNAAVEGSLAAA